MDHRTVHRSLGRDVLLTHRSGWKQAGTTVPVCASGEEHVSQQFRVRNYDPGNQQPLP
jgi:hypothetical protein